MLLQDTLLVTLVKLVDGIPTPLLRHQGHGSSPERLAARRCAAPRTLVRAGQASQDGVG